VHLLVSELRRFQNARCKDKNHKKNYEQEFSVERLQEKITALKRSKSLQSVENFEYMGTIPANNKLHA